MGIATFSPAIKATAVRDSLSRVIVAIKSEEPALLCIDGDGLFEWMLIHDVVVDLRYDPKTQAWTDPTEESTSE